MAEKNPRRIPAQEQSETMLRGPSGAWNNRGLAMPAEGTQRRQEDNHRGHILLEEEAWNYPQQIS